MYKIIVKIGLFIFIFQHFGLAKTKKNACSKLIYYPFKDISSNCFYNPDELGKTPDIIIRHGYPLEVHKVRTSDDYILTLYRIPSKLINGTPAFLQHGFMASSDQWVVFGNRSLAFRLHDLGYDVWLGNNRGTQYSKGHISLKFSDNTYWNFSLDTLAQYDIRDSIKHVVGKTKTPIIYIGHSMGTTLIAMFSSEFPNDSQELIRGIIALSPVIYGATNAFETIYKWESLVHTQILEFLHIYGYMTKHIPIIKGIVQKFCFAFPFVCREAINIAVGKTNQLTPEDLFLLLGTFPQGTATRVLGQLAQILHSGKFRKYDYGTKTNLEMYGAKEPPNYDLKKIKTPFFLYYGLNDAFINTKSVTKGFREIGSERKKLSVIPKNEKVKFNHLDFISGKDVETYLYKYMFEAMETF